MDRGGRCTANPAGNQRRGGHPGGRGALDDAGGRPCPGALVTEGPDNAAENDAEARLVGLVEVGGLRVLVTGDLMAGQQARSSSGQELSADVLVVPHHGSPHRDRTSSAQWASPDRWGAERLRGHPDSQCHGVAEQCGAQVFRTDQHGAGCRGRRADRGVVSPTMTRSTPACGRPRRVWRATVFSARSTG